MPDRDLGHAARRRAEMLDVVADNLAGPWRQAVLDGATLLREMAETLALVAAKAGGGLMTTIRVPVEVPELTSEEIAALREYAKPPHERLTLIGPNAARAFGVLCARGLLHALSQAPTPLGRAVLEHYEGGR